MKSFFGDALSFVVIIIEERVIFLNFHNPNFIYFLLCYYKYGLMHPKAFQINFCYLFGKINKRHLYSEKNFQKNREIFRSYSTLKLPAI